MIDWTTVLSTVAGAALGSGIISVIVNWMLERRSSREESEVLALREQLNKVYGPLHFLTSFNENLFRLLDKYKMTYQAEYCGKTFAPESLERVRRESRALQDEENSYMRIVMENNRKILNLLQDAWYLVDLDDMECFANFQIDMSRLERTEDHPGITSFITQQHIGPIPYMRPDMVKRVKEKFKAKQERLGELMGRHSARSSGRRTWNRS